MKYIDNYILALLLGLELGYTVRYNNTDDLPEYIKTTENRRLEKNFIQHLKTVVFDSLPLKEHNTLYNRTLYKVSKVDKDTLDIGLSASEMDIPTLDEVLTYITTNAGDFPIQKTPNTDELLKSLKQYVNALKHNDIEGNSVSFTKWDSRVKKFTKAIDKDQPLCNYIIDSNYLKHIPLLLYGYINNLVIFNDFTINLKQIPFCYECEDSTEPVPRPLVNSDSEADYVELLANVDITKLYEELTRANLTPSKSNKHFGFSSNQWELVRSVILDYYNNDNGGSISHSDIRRIMSQGKSKSVLKNKCNTNENKLAQNNVSKIETIFNSIFRYDLFDHTLKAGEFYYISDNVRNNIGYIMTTLGLDDEI